MQVLLNSKLDDFTDISYIPTYDYIMSYYLLPINNIIHITVENINRINNTFQPEATTHLQKK